MEHKINEFLKLKLNATDYSTMLSLLEQLEMEIYEEAFTAGTIYVKELWEELNEAEPSAIPSPEAWKIPILKIPQMTDAEWNQRTKPCQQKDSILERRSFS